MEGEHPQGHGEENGEVKYGIESSSMVGTLRAASEINKQVGRYT
jgi:hypothetical protein